MSRSLTALVLGNSDSADACKRRNLGNDATDISAKLAGLAGTRIDAERPKTASG